MQCDFDPDRYETGSRGDRARNPGPPVGAADALVHLHFDWRSHWFDAVLKRGGGHVRDLTVTSDLGLMPYSAEGLQRRINIFAILRATRGGFPIRIDLTERQGLKLTARATLPNPVTARAAIAGVTTLLAQARPYLDMIQLMQPVSNSVRIRH